MSQPDPTNERVAGAAAARLALTGSAALWLALVASTLGNEVRLRDAGAAAKEPASPVIAGGRLPAADARRDPRVPAAARTATVDDVAAERARSSDEVPDVASEAVPDSVSSAGPDIGSNPRAGVGEGRETAAPVVRASPESAFEARRREALERLAALLAEIAFEPGAGALAAGSEASLERALEILLLYPRTRVDIVVESRESDDAEADWRLGLERASTLVDALVERGVARERLAAGTSEGRGLPYGEHRVRVSVEDEER